MPSPCPVRLPRALLLSAAFVMAAAAGRADEFHLFPASAPASPSLAEVSWEGEPTPPAVELEQAYPWATGRPAFSIALAAPHGHGDFQEPPTSLSVAPPPPPKLFTTGTTLVTAGAVLAGALQGMGAPLQYGWRSFHTTNEGWFGRNTYTGGADKASHFVISSGVSRLLYETYTHQGHTVDQSFNLAVATAFMTGTMVEFFDGFSVYGWSFQDLTADALGSAAGALIHRYCLQDMLGIRVGLAYTNIPNEIIGASEPTLGRSYNDEIYAADLKFGGLITRLHGKPGFARFFMTSFVFYTRGFGYLPPLPDRYQEIGVELGLNIPEILMAVGVKDNTWWGTGLLAFFNFFRVPFTQVGVYYNLFNNKWYGPGAPYHYY